MRKFFSFIAAVLFAGSMMAAEVTVTKTTTELAGTYSWVKSVGQSIGTLATNFALDEAITVSTTGEANCGSLWQDDWQWRLYTAKNGNAIITAAEGYTIKSVTLTFVNSNNGVLKHGEDAITSGTAYNVNASSITFVVEGGSNATGNNGQIRVTQFSVVYDLEGEVVPTMDYYVAGSMTSWAPRAAYKLAANPAVEGEYMGEFTFAANDEFKVVYSDGSTIADENWFPTGMGNNWVINEAGDYDVYFRPAGNTEWANGYFTAIKKEAPVVTPLSLTEFIAAAPTAEVTLVDLTVIYANNKNTYVIDADGVALVIYDASKTYYDGTLTAGKVLSGQKATYTLYKNQDEIIPTNAVEATDGVAPVPTLLNAKPTDANINRYVSFKNVAATENNGKYYIFEDVQLYGATSDLKPSAAGNYDIEGIYIVYNGNTPEIIVTGLAASSPTAISNTDAAAKAVKFFENGQLIILKNGVRYNAQGAIVK